MLDIVKNAPNTAFDDAILTPITNFKGQHHSHNNLPKKQHQITPKQNSKMLQFRSSSAGISIDMKNIKKQIETISVPSDNTIRDGLQAINTGAIGVALITEPGTGVFKGLVTDGDLRRALLKGYSFEEPLAKIVPSNAITAREGTPFSEILSLFTKKILIIPILDKENKVVDIAAFDKRCVLPVAEPSIGEKEWEYVSECILTGWVSSTGKFVTKFEEIFGQFCKAKHAITTSNGTTALHLALSAYGIGPGDEVIVPTLTFIATANAVVHTGATPVFVDSEPITWNIDPQKIEQAITKKTKAIIPVHLYGHPADMKPILDIARRHNLVVIEDAAEAHGAEYKGSPVGSIGTMGIFSFFANKIVTTGEGGMVVTNDDALADRMRLMRDHGMDKNRRYWHTVIGFNYRLTNIQAALGLAQMEKIDQILLKKRQNAKLYHRLLKGIPGLTLPYEAEWAKNVYWLYSVLVDENKFGMTRDILMTHLQDMGIETRPVFYPLHEQPIYKTSQHFPIAEHISSQGISLPSSVKLDEEAISQVAHAIAGLAKR